MKRPWKKIFILLAVLLFPLWVFGDPPVYFAKDIRGQVVDGETGKPLEGVVVVARWTYRWIRIGDGSTGGSINTLESVTGKDGKYFIPGWGPRPRPPLAYLDNLDPELRVFKSNYYPEMVANKLLSYANHNSSMTRTSEWDGKVIQLKPFKGDDWDAYGSMLKGFWNSGGSDCLRECPRYVLALDAEDKRIKALKPKELYIPRIVGIENFEEADREFLMRYKNEK
jgi:hypothetical protein